MTVLRARRVARVGSVVLAGALLGLLLSTVKGADSFLGYNARHPLSPATWIVVGLAAGVTICLTRRQAARWLVPIASGAAFFGVAQVAGSDGLPAVQPHVPLVVYATGDRMTLPAKRLEDLATNFDRVSSIKDELLVTCSTGSDTACNRAMHARLLPEIERYRASLPRLVAPLAPDSICLRGLDSQADALPEFARVTRDLVAADLDRDSERIHELQGEANTQAITVRSPMLADLESCVPSGLK